MILPDGARYEESDSEDTGDSEDSEEDSDSEGNENNEDDGNSEDNENSEGHVKLLDIPSRSKIKYDKFKRAADLIQWNRHLQALTVSSTSKWS